MITGGAKNHALRPRSPRRTRALAAIGFLLLYVPLIGLVMKSFVATDALNGTSVLTFDWYRKVLSNPSVLASLEMSLIVASVSTVISTVLGTGAALAIVRRRFWGRGALDTLTHLPLVMPEIVLGLSLLIWFVALRISLGAFSMILAHVTFSVSYVLITVKARLEGFDKQLEEAAKDLGASRLQVFTKITLPLAWPGILSGALMAFTLSFDDFLITFFTTGVGTDTLPLKIYSMIKFGVSPEINALSTLLLGATFLLVMLFFGRAKVLSGLVRSSGD